MPPAKAALAVVLLLAISCTSAGRAAADRAGARLDPWEQLVAGIRLRRGHATAAFGVKQGRRQELTALEIDLDTPGLRLVTNPPGGVAVPPRPGHQVHTQGGTLSDLLAARPEIRVAVNANFFWPCCELAGPGERGMTLFGLAVEAGAVVADPAELQHPPGCRLGAVPAVPDRVSVGAPALLVGEGNVVTFALVTASPADPRPASMPTVAAVAGGPQPDPRAAFAPGCPSDDGYPPGRPVPGPAFLLQGGRTAAVARANPPELVAARTFVGLSANGRRLFLATIDGDENGAGAAFFDEASWLQLLGATEGLNLDGGGSTSMVLRTAGLNGAPSVTCPATAPGLVLLDVPDNGERCVERLIGTYLGVAIAE